MGHAYQGIAGILRTGLIGPLYAAAYVGTGDLLAPLLLHAVTDGACGMVAYLALKPATAVGGQRA